MTTIKPHTCIDTGTPASQESIDRWEAKFAHLRHTTKDDTRIVPTRSLTVGMVISANGSGELWYTLTKIEICNHRYTLTLLAPGWKPLRSQYKASDIWVIKNTSPVYYTEIELGIIVCNYCGAYAETEESVKHFSSCDRSDINSDSVSPPNSQSSQTINHCVMCGGDLKDHQNEYCSEQCKGEDLLEAMNEPYSPY